MYDVVGTGHRFARANCCHACTSNTPSSPQLHSQIAGYPHFATQSLQCQALYPHLAIVMHHCLTTGYRPIQHKRHAVTISDIKKACPYLSCPVITVVYVRFAINSRSHQYHGSRSQQFALIAAFLCPLSYTKFTSSYILETLHCDILHQSNNFWSKSKRDAMQSTAMPQYDVCLPVRL